MSIKKTLGEKYAKYKIRIGRGSSYTSEINGLLDATGKVGVLALLINTYFNAKIPVWVFIVAWPIQKTIEYTLGYLDEKHLRWWHYENEYVSRNLNPYNQEVLTKLNDIYATQIRQVNQDNPIKHKKARRRKAKITCSNQSNKNPIKETRHYTKESFD